MSKCEECKIEKCVMCGKNLVPDLKAVVFRSFIWDGHTYFVCKCLNISDANYRMSIG